MAIAGLDVGVGVLAASHVLKPVADVGRTLIIRARVGRGFYDSSLGQLLVGQYISLHVHLFRVPFRQSTITRHPMSLQIQCAAVGVIDLLDAAGRIRLSRRVDYLKALRWIVKRTVIEDGTHGVPILASVVPNVATALCDHTARARKMREPVHGVDLVYHPLAGNAR